MKLSHRYIPARQLPDKAVSLLDQPTLPAQPAPWVPSSVISYTHFSFDIGQAYQTIKNAVVEQMGPPGMQYFAQAEGGFMMFSGADLTAAITALGNKHTFVQWNPTWKQIDIGEDEQMEMPMNRMGFVLELRDEALWKNILQMLIQGPGTAVGRGTGFYGLSLRR